MLSNFKFNDYENISDTKFMKQLKATRDIGDKKMVKKKPEQSKSIDF